MTPLTAARRSHAAARRQRDRVAQRAACVHGCHMRHGVTAWRSVLRACMAASHAARRDNVQRQRRNGAPWQRQGTRGEYPPSRLRGTHRVGLARRYLRVIESGAGTVPCVSTRSTPHGSTTTLVAGTGLDCGAGTGTLRLEYRYR
jgi:hypothetical protein